MYYIQECLSGELKCEMENFYYIELIKHKHNMHA